MNQINCKLQKRTVSGPHIITDYVKQKSLVSYRKLITILELDVFLFRMLKGKFDITNLIFNVNTNNILKSAVNKFGRSVTADLKR